MLLSSKLSLTLAAALLSGCSLLPVRSVQITPPESLLQACLGPSWRPSTNGELLDYSNALRDALAACDDDKTALREWAKEAK